MICGGKASGLIGAMGSAALAKGGKVKAIIPTIFRGLHTVVISESFETVITSFQIMHLWET